MKILAMIITLILSLQIALAAGSGGGGSGGGFSSIKLLNYEPKEISLSPATTYKIDLAAFFDDYNFQVEDISTADTTVDIKLTTKSDDLITQVKLATNEKQSFDLNNDGNNDIEIKLIAVTKSLARIEFVEKKPKTSGEDNANMKEPELKCGDLATLKERVKCRIDLNEYELGKELELQYLPEECRAISNLGVKNSCIQRYKSVQQCWEQPVGPSRISCVKRQFNLGDIKSEKAACLASNPEDKDDCLAGLDDKVFALVKFRIYDLEERAEELIGQGANEETVVDLVSELEERKLEFNEAQTIEDKKSVIKEVKVIWQEFILGIKDDILK